MSSHAVPTRRLGKDGPLVPAMGFGLMMMTATSYGDLPDDNSRFALLDHAFHIGATFWDTSDMYGDNEKLLAKWFQKTGKRDEVFLASKFGYVPGSKPLEIDSSPNYCKKACESTLKTLGIDCLDLYYVHNVDTVTPIEHTMQALVELQREGKIKHIGLSMVSARTIRRAAKIAPIAAYQPAYSVFEQAIEGDLGTHALEACRELGIAIVCATPLGRGILTERYIQGDSLSSGQDVRVLSMPQFQSNAREQNTSLVKQLDVLAKQKGCSLPQLALAWLLKQGDDIIPIPGTKQIRYLDDNMGALNITLSDEEEKKMREIVTKTPISGGSVPDAFSAFIFRDTKEQ